MLSNFYPHLFILLLLREDPLQRGVQRVGQQELRYLARSQRRQKLKNLTSRVRIQFNSDYSTHCDRTGFEKQSTNLLGLSGVVKESLLPAGGDRLGVVPRLQPRVPRDLHSTAQMTLSWTIVV